MPGSSLQQFNTVLHYVQSDVGDESSYKIPINYREYHTVTYRLSLCSRLAHPTPDNECAGDLATCSSQCIVFRRSGPLLRTGSRSRHPLPLRAASDVAGDDVARDADRMLV